MAIEYRVDYRLERTDCDAARREDEHGVKIPGEP